MNKKNIISWVLFAVVLTASAGAIIIKEVDVKNATKEYISDGAQEKGITDAEMAAEILDAAAIRNTNEAIIKEYYELHFQILSDPAHMEAMIPHMEAELGIE